MKAIRIHETGGPGVLRYEDVEKPKCKPGEVLVQIECISINYADILIRRGVYPFMPKLPAILGAEAAGYIEECGDEVFHLKPGQKVIVFGFPTYCSYVSIPAQRAIPIPDHADLQEAASIPIIYLTAYHSLYTVRKIQEKEKILVYGAAGGVGTASIQLAKFAGTKVIGITSLDEKAAFIKKQGVTHVINYTKENVVERVLELTDGTGVDLILDSVGGDSFADNFKMLNDLGHVIWLGATRGLPKVDLLSILNENTAKSYGVSVFHLYSIVRNPELLYNSLKSIIDLWLAGEIKPVIQDHFPLGDAAAAHIMLEERHNIGKIILKPPT